MKFLVCDLRVINTPKDVFSGDRFISYENPPENFEITHPVHAPISWHSYAAAMNGRFVTAPKDNWQDHVDWADVILVLWQYLPEIAMQAIFEMKKKGKKIIGAFHENGSLFQAHARDLTWLIDFKNCANACDAVLTYPRNKIFSHVYESIGISAELLYIPQPYHVEKRKDYIIERQKRNGIFIGPRKKDTEVENRNWIFNVAIAATLINKPYLDHKQISNRITIINQSRIYSNDTVKTQLTTLFPDCSFEVIPTLSYASYLRVIATHQLTINIDGSDTQGQVDADSMFVGVPVYQHPDFDYRTDFGDIYYKKLNEGIDAYQAIEQIMTDICSFEHVKNIIYSWYEKLK